MQIPSSLRFKDWWYLFFVIYIRTVEGVRRYRENPWLKGTCFRVG